MTDKFEELNQAFQLTDAENAAHYVFHEIQKLKDNRGNVQMRWVWELLQNAHDAREPNGNALIVVIEYCSEKLVFLHNGRGFKADEIAHLIKSGTTKDEADKGTHGKFGRGFLTTHLLSPTVKVAGPLDNGTWFNFTLMRNDESKVALTESLRQSQKDFMRSISPHKPSSIPDQFTTQFVYPICEAGAEEAVRAGIETLEQCAPYLVIFNKEFSRIDIRTPHKTWCFKAVDDRMLDTSGIQQITVVESRNENETEMEYLLAKSEPETSVAVPMQSNGDSLMCLPVENTPRLFLAFPLVGTDSFSFPAVINSPNFSSTPDRDVLIFGGKEASNIKNRDVIKEACSLLVRLIEYAASKGWQHIHRWAEIPPIQNLNWINPKWLKDCIKEKLIKEIQYTPVILNQTGKAIPLNEAMLPIAESDENLEVLVETLWDLLNDWQEYHEKLPRRDEATGWCEAIQSWIDVSGEDTSMFDKAIDGRKLTSHFEEKTKASQGWGHIENLRKLLQAHVCEIEWLNRFYGFLWYNGFDGVIRNHRVVLNQEGWFRELPNLLRDSDIDKNLKEIAQLLALRIQWDLFDIRITSLAEETETKYADNEYVLERLIKELQKRTDNNPDDNNFKEASARLFAWIVRQDQKDWNRLRNVPVFTEDSTVYHSLLSASPNSKLPLAPVRSWSEDLQQFSDLFPPERILADAFFEDLPDPDVWRMLDAEKFIRWNMIIRGDNTGVLNWFSPDVYEDTEDQGDHTTMDTFSWTKVVGWEEIMSRVTKSPVRARLFWRFLTEWLIKEDVQSLEAKKAKCEFCGEGIMHKYYPAVWLKAVRRKRWIRQGNLYVRADAQSLANLLREKGLELRSLEDPVTVKLLKAIDVPLSDLKFELITGSPEARNALVSTMTELHQITGGDLSQVNAIVQHVQKIEGDLTQTLEVIQHMQEDENFSEYFAERQEQTRRVHENQHLGAQVENLVKVILRDNDFKVERTGTGSDFEITLNVSRNDQSWLIEVKSTRQDGDHQSVSMTSTQAQTAEKEKEKFLLCVVPLEQEYPTEENVKEKMLFIQNIGARIAPLREKLDKLTDYTSTDLELKVEKKNVRVLVKKSLWDREGFPLTDLLEYLK